MTPFFNPLVSNDDYAIQTLSRFLRHPLSRTDEVFQEFMSVPNCLFNRSSLNSKQGFLFIEGSRKNKVLIVAHADTVWDFSYRNKIYHQVPVCSNGIFEASIANCGIGADDRAGCAMAFLLKETGHSILITDGEEQSMTGSKYLMNYFPVIADALNKHCFLIQLDRQGKEQFKCYGVGSDEFRKYIMQKTGYQEPNRSSFTDIVTLCREACGVNLSVGYYGEHYPGEKLVIADWLQTYNMLKKWLSEDNHPTFIRTEEGLSI